ncbi:MAG: cytochrome P450 [Xanthomonadales bacterium]|nr:cytochrome P450 [Xanthomonadales bacterium]
MAGPQHFRARAWTASRFVVPDPVWLTPFGYLCNPYFIQQQADRYGRTFKLNQFGTGAGPDPRQRLWQPVVCVMGMERAQNILREHDARLLPTIAPFNRFVPKGYLRYMQHQDHARYRKILQEAIKPAVIDANMPLIEQHLKSKLPGLASAVNEHRLAPEDALKELAFAWFILLFFGLAPGDARMQLMRHLYAGIDVASDNDTEVEEALNELGATVLELAQTYLDPGPGGTQPGPSVVGEIVLADSEALRDINTLRNLIYMAQASWIDFSGLLGWLFKTVCEEPAWAARLRQEAVSALPPDAAPLSLRFVQEVLRLHQSEYLYRTVLADISFDGFTIPTGWLLRFCTRENHRDPAIFDQPDAFNPDRFLDPAPTRKEYSPFGASRIACLGVHLTHRLATCFLLAVTENFDCSVVRDGPLEFRRWHWKPSSKFHARMVKRTAG